MGNLRALPAFGDVVGLTRLCRQSAARIRPKDRPELAHKLVWTEELTRQDRAATQVESPSAAASSAGQGGASLPDPARDLNLRRGARADFRDGNILSSIEQVQTALYRHSCREHGVFPHKAASGNADNPGVSRRFLCADDETERLENRRGVKASEGSNPSLSGSSNDRQSLVGPRGIRSIRDRSSVDSGGRTGSCRGDPHAERDTRSAGSHSVSRTGVSSSAIRTSCLRFHNPESRPRRMRRA
jgi:hypothetical protein